MTIVVDESFFKLHHNKISLYYDKFKYRARIPIPNIHFYRDQKHIRLKSKDKTNSITTFLDWKETVRSRNDLAIRISVNTIYVYTNDIGFIKDLIKSTGHTIEKYQLNYVVQPKNFDRHKIYLKHPKFRYRLYFKWAKVDDNDVNNLIEFIDIYQIKCSDSLSRWINKRHSGSILNHYIWDNYFFEFDNEMIVTLMTLKFGNIVRRVCDIEKR
jgi:hypothetical protein